MAQTAYLSVAEAAAELEITKSGVYKLIQRGQLKALRKTAHGIRIPRLALDAYRRGIDRPASVVASYRGEPGDSDLQRSAFVRDTGVDPAEWVRRWKADEVQDTVENMHLTIQALGLLMMERGSVSEKAAVVL
ncbi:MAG: helix-turn-helix domain-containing protein [Thermoleophilia bacterium]|nr:helix-turn-helix domain-containing protein [Thermoleophilia bacterium]